MNKKKHPTFRRPNYGRTKRKRIKDNWRRPRGIDCAQRKKLKKAGKHPSIGYKNPDALQHLHPSGKHEVLISSASEVELLALEPKNTIIRIRKSVGKKKRELIRKIAFEKGYEVVN